MPFKLIVRKVRSLFEKTKPIINVVRDVFATAVQIVLFPFTILVIAELFLLSAIIVSVRGAVRFISSHRVHKGELV